MYISKRRAGELMLALLLLLLIPMLFFLARGVVIGEPERPSGLAGSHFCYDQPGEPAAITQAAAIQRARESVAAQKQSNALTAQYVLFSDDECNQYQVEGTYTREPAWVITFHNVNVPSEDGRRIYTETHVVVHAKTGQFLMSFHLE